MLGQYTADDGLVLHQGSLEDVDSLDLPADYVIHTACPTASSFFMSHPVETFSAIVDGTRSMLELARRRGAASFVYVSSMEIYGMGNKQRGTEHLLDESAVGYIDPCSVRSCYSEGKRAAENLCVSYHSEYQVPVKAVRLRRPSARHPSRRRPPVRGARTQRRGRQGLRHEDDRRKHTNVLIHRRRGVRHPHRAGSRGRTASRTTWPIPPPTRQSARWPIWCTANSVRATARVIIDVDPNGAPTRRSTTCHSTCHALRRSAGGRR